MLFSLHLLSFLAHGDKLACAALKSHNRRLVDDDLVVVDYDRVGRAEVNSDFFSEREQSHLFSMMWIGFSGE